MATDDETALRAKLRAAGFHPLPLAGKRPAMDRWSQKINVNIDEIRLWKKLYPWSENTGILTTNTPTIDIDIMIPDAAEAVEGLVRDMFDESGHILIRFGRSPKRAIPLRTDDPFKKIATDLIGPDGKADGKVEILADGQQVAVHGIHPDTKKPYSWHGGELGDVTRNDLPYIHPQQAQTFIERCTELLIRDFGFTRSKPAASKASGAGEFHHADWTALVANIATGANLHDSIRDLAASFVANNISNDTAARLLQSLMLASAIPHDDRWQERFEEISRAVISAYEKFARGEKPVVLKFIDMSSWDTVPAPDREWSVCERIPARQAALLSGEGSIGKTILELQLCVAHVLGSDWIGSLPKKGPVIYLGAEDDADELHRRLQAIIEHYTRALGYNVTFRTLIDNGLHLLSFAGEDCMLGVPNRNGQIAPTALYDRLLEAVQDIKPVHIGIDTSADVFGGNEIDRVQVRQFLSMLRKLAIVCNGAVVLLAHPSLEGIKSGTGISGSTGWHNSVRARMYFKTAKAGDDDDADLRELEFKKNNYGPVADTIKLEYHNGIFRPPHSASDFEKRAREARVDSVFLNIFGKLIAQGRADFSIYDNTQQYTPKQIAAHPDGKEFTKADYADAMQRLLDAKPPQLHVVTEHSKGRKDRERLAMGPPPKPETDDTS